MAACPMAAAPQLHAMPSRPRNARAGLLRRRPLLATAQPGGSGARGEGHVRRRAEDEWGRRAGSHDHAFSVPSFPQNSPKAPLPSLPQKSRAVQLGAAGRGHPAVRCGARCVGQARGRVLECGSPYPPCLSSINRTFSYTMEFERLHVTTQPGLVSKCPAPQPRGCMHGSSLAATPPPWPSPCPSPCPIAPVVLASRPAVQQCMDIPACIPGRVSAVGMQAGCRVMSARPRRMQLPCPAAVAAAALVSLHYIHGPPPAGNASKLDPCPAAPTLLQLQGPPGGPPLRAQLSSAGRARARAAAVHAAGSGHWFCHLPGLEAALVPRRAAQAGMLQRLDVYPNRFALLG